MLEKFLNHGIRKIFCGHYHRYKYCFWLCSMSGSKEREFLLFVSLLLTHILLSLISYTKINFLMVEFCWSPCRMYEHFFTRPLTTLTLILTVLSYLLHDFASQCLLDKSRILISLDPKSLRCIILGHFVLYAFGVMYAQLYSLLTV